MRANNNATALAVLAILAVAVALSFRAHSSIREWESSLRQAVVPPLAPPLQEDSQPQQHQKVDVSREARVVESGPASSFHGMFSCNIGTPCPSYTAGFLTSRGQLLDNPVTEAVMERANTNMETASYYTMGRRGKYDVWRTVDALDFSVEHMSMYERLLRSRSIRDSDSVVAHGLYDAFLERLRQYESRMRHKCSEDVVVLDPEGERTIAVMPYYAAGGAGSGHTAFESKALYLNITLFSMRCHFGAVAVSCLHEGDRAYLAAGKGLPRIDEILWVDPNSLAVNKPSFLGISTIRAAQQRWRDEKWPYSFMYYTEADQVLHLRSRHRRKLYRCLTQGESSTTSTAEGSSSKTQSLGRRQKFGILTPHRLNTLPRAQDYENLTRAFAFDDEVAVRMRKELHNLDASYNPKKDSWFKAVFGKERHAWIRRELDGLGAKTMTRFLDDVDFVDGSCCYLKSNETSYPYDIRGKEGNVRLDDQVAGEFGATRDAKSPLELMAVGDYGLGILAGQCCHICARAGKLGRHCDNYCTPARPGHENCARGAFAED